MTRKELEKYLQDKMNWFINYGNPFQEATMVAYINNGLQKLHNMNMPEQKMLVMYDLNNELMFKEC